VNEQINPNHPLRSIIEPLYDVLSGTTEGMPTTTGVTQQPTVSETQQVSQGVSNQTNISDIRSAIQNAEVVLPGVNWYGTFHNAIDKMEDAGRPDVRAAMPTMLRDTIALFWLWEGDKVFDPDNPEETEKQYARFMEEYIRDPQSKRRGPGFNKRVQYIGNLMEQDQQNLSSTKPETGWLQNAFINNDMNAAIIEDLYRTRGSRDWYASGIHNQNRLTREYWTNMGESNTDIFRRLTAQRPKVEGESQIMDDTESILRPPERIQSGWNGQAI
jgi:hypothetical protein